MVSEFAILAQKWSKIAPLKKNLFMVFANHPAVHSGGGGGSVAVTVGVSDI